jgi:uncharacterized protein (TIGR02246 family)
MTELDSLFETYKVAVFQKDIEVFASIFDEKVRVFDMWGPWAYDGLDDWREMAKAWFASLGTDRDVVEFEDIQIHTAGNLATATAIMKFIAVTEKGEELRYLHNRLTWIAEKKNDVWKIIHQHTSGPVDFETMKVMLKKPTLA